MPEVVNTQAKTLLMDFDFSGEDAHIAYTINALGGSATQESEEKPYLTKSGNVTTLTDEQKAILNSIKKADVIIDSLEDKLYNVVKDTYLTIPDMYLSVWIEKFDHETVVYSVDYYYTYAASYTVDSDGNVTLGDEKTEVERKSIYVELEKSAAQTSSNFAYTPDLNDPLSWRFKMDKGDDVIASVSALSDTFKGNKVTLPDECRDEVVAKLSKSYKEFFPTENLPKVLAPVVKSTSGAASDEISKTNVPCGINIDDKEKKNMSDDKKVAEEVEATKSALVDLQKSLTEMAEQLKVSDERAVAAEQATADVHKAAAAEKLAKEKSELTEVVKGWKSIENTEDVVTAILKSGDGGAILVTAMEALHSKVDEVKKTFGETENGVDGEVVAKSYPDAAKEAVAAVLKNRKSKKS